MHPSRPKKTARLCAVKILQQSISEKQPIKPVFDRHILRAQLASKDKNLTKELVYGVLRRKEELDTALSHLSHTPLKKIDPLLYYILVTGLYQILFLERIPDAAAVNEAVACCKTQKKVAKRLYGFVNGILRQAVRSKKEILCRLSQTREPLLNHPSWLTKRWQQRFGKGETTRICTVNNRPPLLVLRINPKKTERTTFCNQLDRKHIPWVAAQFAPDAVILPEGARINDIPGYEKGVFQVQDQAAQLCSLLMAPFFPKELKILDACGGVGGKTSHLLQLAATDATIHAVEPEPFRMHRLEEIQQKNNTANLRLYQQDFLSFCPETQFDRILVDAPCSGTGVLRRNPDIRWSRTKDEILAFQQRQLALLDHAAALAAPDAVLVYATCSMEQEENEEVIADFLENHPEFTLSNPKPFLPESAQRFVHNNFFVPHPEEEIDGFFSARMEKNR